MSVRFSSRSGWDRRLNPITERLEQLRARGAELIDLTESNPLRCGLAYPEAAIQAALTAPLEYEPDPRGLRSAREALSAWLGGEVAPDALLLTASTSEAYALLFKLLCDPGDEVLVLTPGYPLLDVLAELEAVRLGKVPLLEATGWALDVEALRAWPDDRRTRAVVVVNPVNPTGQFLKRAELTALSRLCAERGWALIADEVFAGYGVGVDPERVTGVLSEPAEALTFSLSGLSKVAGLPQLKLGWIAVGGPEALRAEALARLELIADGYLSVATPVQHALGSLLALTEPVRGQLRARLAENRAALRSLRTAEAAWDVLPSEGGWYAVLRVPMDETALCLRLLDAGVVVQPGHFFDFPSPGYLVLSLLPEPARFRLGAERLAATI